MMAIHKPMIGLVLGLGAALALGGCATTGETMPAKSTDGVFVHISSGADQPHDVLMGLRMAQLMSEEHPALVYFDVGGIDIVLAEGPDLEMSPFGSSHDMIADLLARDVTLFACPGCLKATGHTADELMPGVKVAEKDAFFDFAEGRILTIDY
jgi:intracellular sulfur oxidation DsrE/DsrF family protein